MTTKVLKNLSQEDTDLTLRIFDLMLGRVFKRIYLGLDGEERKDMEKVFISGSEEEKNEFVRRSIPDLNTILKEEAENIEKEIEEEIEKQA